MTHIMIGLGSLVLIFLLVILLGLQMQISGLTRRLDELIEKVTKE